MPVKAEQHPALTHEERVERLQQLTRDLEKAVDLAEARRRVLRDIARDANELAESVSASGEMLAEVSFPPKRRATKKR